GYRALAELGQVHRRLQERQHHFLGARGKCSPFAKPADVARQPFEGAQERDLCPFQVARFAARAGKADFRGTEARRELQHPAELVLRAIEIAELVEIDLAERPPPQHLGLAASPTSAARRWSSASRSAPAAPPGSTKWRWRPTTGASRAPWKRRAFAP